MYARLRFEFCVVILVCILMWYKSRSHSSSSRELPPLFSNSSLVSSSPPQADSSRLNMKPHIQLPPLPPAKALWLFVPVRCETAPEMVQHFLYHYITFMAIKREHISVTLYPSTNLTHSVGPCKSAHQLWSSYNLRNVTVAGWPFVTCDRTNELIAELNDLNLTDADWWIQRDIDEFMTPPRGGSIVKYLSHMVSQNITAITTNAIERINPSTFLHAANWTTNPLSSTRDESMIPDKPGRPTARSTYYASEMSMYAQYTVCCRSLGTLSRCCSVRKNLDACQSKTAMGLPKIYAMHSSVLSEGAGIHKIWKPEVATGCSWLLPPHLKHLWRPTTKQNQLFIPNAIAHFRWTDQAVDVMRGHKEDTLVTNVYICMEQFLTWVQQAGMAELYEKGECSTCFVHSDPLVNWERHSQLRMKPTRLSNNTVRGPAPSPLSP
eukprot:TRINITY_DN61082_c0_g2_i1.p1 TRINITY_DN61082_c0_g2~~TRINITY_DN61082_c0_g2_i1.p1  ORF type:complete len:436 (-),score=5.39 TRINITY_DN61082_c0_g2_i1:63-1370(-)